MDADDLKTQLADERLFYVKFFVEKMANQKPDQWNKMIATEDNRQQIFSFFEDGRNTKLLFLNNGTMMLPYLNDYPSTGTGKGNIVYFLRRTREQITVENMRKVINVGSCTDNVIKDLQTFTDDVLAPILNPINQEGWPKVLVQDFQRKLEELSNAVAEVIGSMNNMTKLSLPITIKNVLQVVPDVLNGNLEKCTFDIKESLEQAVVRWSESIELVVQEQSYDIFKHKKYATPSDEIEFWSARTKNLQNIFKQLTSEETKAVAMILEKIESIYVNKLQRLVVKVTESIDEARNIDLYLKPLQNQLAKFTDFSEGEHLLKPLMHTVVLMWSKSSYFGSNKRMVHIFRLMHNRLIELVTENLDPESIFRNDIADVLLAIKQIIENFDKYKSIHKNFRAELHKHALHPATALWTFDPKDVFEYLDLFIERLKEVHGMVATTFEFHKLEDIVFGGYKGKSITRTVKNVLERFAFELNKLQSAKFNILSLDETSKFTCLAQKFTNNAGDLQRILARQICLAFDECHTIDNYIKLLMNLGSIAKVPIVYEQFKPKLNEITHSLMDEISNVQKLFSTLEYEIQVAQHKKESEEAINRNKMRSLNDVLIWCNQLKSRLQRPIEHLVTLNFHIFESDFGQHTQNELQQTMTMIKTFETNYTNIWLDLFVIDIDQLMRAPLLLRNENGGIETNFASELAKVFEGLNSLLLLDRSIESEALLKYLSKKDSLWDLRLKLMRIAEWYNFVVFQTHETERSLIQNEIEKIDLLLDEPLKYFTWTDHNVSSIRKLFKKLKNLSERVKTCQKNIAQIQMHMQKWNTVPLYERRKSRNTNLLYIEDRNQLVNDRLKLCLESKKVIDESMHENYRLLNNLFVELPTSDQEDEVQAVEAQADKSQNIARIESKPENEQSDGIESQAEEDQVEEVQTASDSSSERLSIDVVCDFLPYQMYVDEIIAKEILKAVDTSLRYIRNEIDNTSDAGSPLFLIEFTLKQRKPVFIPDLEHGFVALISSIIDDIRGIADMITCTAQSEDVPKLQTYAATLANDPTLDELKTEILNKANEAVKSTGNLYKSYQAYERLWIIDRQQYLTQFLKYGRHLTTEDMINIANGAFSEKVKELELETIEEEIIRNRNLFPEIEKLPNFVDTAAWVRVSNKEFKKAVLLDLQEWVNLFINYLRSHVADFLIELDEFVREADVVLSQECEKKEVEKFIAIFSLLSKIEARAVETDAMFEPLKREVELLKKFGEELETKVLKYFVELPQKWNKVKKSALMMNQNIAPTQIYQMDVTRKRITLFEIRAANFRKRFKTERIFDVDCKNPYGVLNQLQSTLRQFNEELNDINILRNLFEIDQPDMSAIQKCEIAIKQAKQLWDYWYAIQYSIDGWKKTTWDSVDVDAIETECKKFGKELRALPTETKAWDPYLRVEANLKNLMTSMRAITELQNPALKERHWLDLKNVTGFEIKITPTTTLSDLLDLNLYKFEDDVKNIVDKSVKEMAMEKSIKDITTVWRDLKFELETHKDLQVLRATDEFIEVLEDHLVQLQNMASSKFIAFFENVVTEWLRTLSIVDQVIKLWFIVQRKWIYLEVVFLGSDDIRKQLPDYANKFVEIDVEFRKELAHMNTAETAVDACTKSELIKVLEQLESDLVKCENALNDYLEQKRLIYPRFYFISSADLLDILSHANEPELVCKHLSKLYDSIANLIFDKEKAMANSMVAKDGEVVQFIEKFSCDGQAEYWLNSVTDTMRKTLRSILHDSLKAYDDKPRDEWIFDWPAQLALVVTQMVWSVETFNAFRHLEGGDENALRNYQKKQVAMLNALINLLLGNLTPGDRQKVMTVCTIDVHSRDVVAKLISTKIRGADAFQWQCQLRHRWCLNANNCFVNICDAQFQYDFEYLGNTPRLVITPLTDRCYITLTQSLHLILGGAPAGPAGTGKTETTKDLGKGLGMMVYVFNCSEQMDYKSCGNIYKGLAQSGAWGCFDEFNRISVEVLSVVAVQVKSILDAIRAKKKVFNFLGEEIKLVSTIGMWITMNPGYAGRAELPENLKSLFRPCAMVVPDFALISEIMLVAEGFQDARLLSRKFITLYTLCKELLSKQDHYDWGLRAIKSVLVVAGALKRSDRDRPEDQVLMRALRDFNLPKIVTEDVSVFMGLIGDLFPALEVPRKQDVEFEESVKKATSDLRLQADKKFILKVVQLEELFAVRHSVFVIGFTGTGKSRIWQTLNQTYKNQGKRPHYDVLDPKAVTNDELFGIINPTTREWKDGLFSVIMRDQANMPGDGPKWIVLDGDIDPMWIESLNTLMDDNKILTLASNERIALKSSMRLLFEISNLRTATPATVSRAGILYINQGDVGWQPFVASWLDRRESKSEKSLLEPLFERYIEPVDKAVQKMKLITPVTTISMIMLTCNLLEYLLTPRNLPEECPKEWYEIYFVFAVAWGFGSALYQDQTTDWRNEFSKWFVGEFQTVKFPSGEGNIFNFFVDDETKEFKQWSTLLPKFVLNPEVPLQSTLVNTTETIRMRFFLETFIGAKNPIMLVGGPGCGKSLVVTEKLNGMADSYAVEKVSLNFYTTSFDLQAILEKPLEKKAGRSYGPIGGKSMIYFIDDLNMPEVDKYFTVQCHTIVRQFFNYRYWYDRTKLSLKEILNCQVVSCMNPKAGSFHIDPRLQRHFATFAISDPSSEAIKNIYRSILSQHVAEPANAFPKDVQKMCDSIVEAAISLNQKMNQLFLPTALKFHYNFNLRDLTNIFASILWANGQCCPNPMAFVRLWLHESTRVYGDKLINVEDQTLFSKQLKEIMSKQFAEIDQEVAFEEPNILFHFAESLNDEKYMPVKSWAALNKTLMEAMVNYNDLIGTMSLVLFEDAMSHICRVSRILCSERGNALLVGVGGSGKQSLTRLAASINSLEVFQTNIRKGFSIQDLKIDLSALYVKAGMKNVPCCYLMTDSQVADEKFLVLINDFLATGNIADLLPQDEMDNIINAMRNEVKQEGLIDSTENCWSFFINKVRRSLKVVLCFSPVGSTFRQRMRKFPALMNCTSIDWFFDWPTEALESVSVKFLAKISILPQQLIQPISTFMAYVHGTVNEMSKTYYQNEKRYNYTTPKTFLELIALYSKIINEKYNTFTKRIEALEIGLLKLANCSSQVDVLQEQLIEQEVVLAAKNKEANEQLEIVSTENSIVQVDRDFAAEKEKAVRIIEEDVSAKAKACALDLKKAEPIMEAAIAALDTLDKNSLTELKAFGSPPEQVVMVCIAVLILFTKKGKKVPTPAERNWKNCKIMMGKVDTFLSDLKNYDKKNIRKEVIDALVPYLKSPEFNPQNIVAKSKAASGLCEWVINIHKFYEVYLNVEPKEKALAASEQELKEAQDTLVELNERLSRLQHQLDILQEKLDEAVGIQQACQAEADRTNKKINLAHRLVDGLASEKIRWEGQIDLFKSQIDNLPGDVLLISCFLSYVGCFTSQYRNALQANNWMPKLESIEPKIPFSDNCDPVNVMSDDAVIAEWNNQGLPKDRMSVENAIILVNSDRWPLIIDPQLQGIKWIKKKYGEDLIIASIAGNYLDIIEKAITNGSTILLEGIGESVDAVLDPVLGRMLAKRGNNMVIVIGEKEIDYNPEFRLLLQTKINNPHFKPEIQAQTTLINFSVTKDGLKQQLLAEVVQAERADLEELKSNLTQEQNGFKITLKKLEEDLLLRLSQAGENVLDDESLVLNLEATKKTSADIEQKVKQAKITSAEIDETRLQYKSASDRAAILYFILNDLYKVNPIYRFSLKAFIVVFHRSIALTPSAEDTKQRVILLQDSVTYQVFLYTCRALFERDKLTFTAQMAIQILLNNNEINQSELEHLLRFPSSPGVTSPVEFLSNHQWGNLVALEKFPDLAQLQGDIKTSAKRWKTLCEMLAPEREKLPGDWKNKSAIQRLCILRSLRPDRMTYAIRSFIEENLGSKYVEARSVSFTETFNETSNGIHTFFTLSPGVDPMRDVEKLGKVLGYTFDAMNFHSISLGQGQEIEAEKAMDIATKQGHWVFLQNIHLVVKWLPTLEKKIEASTESSHENYRLFLSADPPSTPEFHVLPQGVLESAIKITNEPPTGMQANLHKALDNFNEDTFEMCTKVTEFKAILFSLCYFHACVCERRKFGAQGWNRNYPFNFGDLVISVNVLHNYLEANTTVPYEDLRYLFGEIMYGGHITDDFDRRLCRAYLESYVEPMLLEGELYLAPKFLAPQSLDYSAYHEYIDANLPLESPELYGLHSNTEIGVLTAASIQMFDTLLELQPKTQESTASDGQSREEIILGIIEDFQDKLPAEFDIREIMTRAEAETPYNVVVFQECDRMNILMREIKRSLKELLAGLNGVLTITPQMESLEEALYNDFIPENWNKLAYPSDLKLQGWFADLQLRLIELETWSAELMLPASVWLTGLFNPQSFLTAIMQQTARKNQWPLDRMCLNIDVTRKTKNEVTTAGRDGANIHGLFMEGACWDTKINSIADAQQRELFAMMPVIHVIAVTQDKQETKNVYECPIYKVRSRGPTYVWTFNLKTKEKPVKWILAGVCLLLQN